MIYFLKENFQRTFPPCSLSKECFTTSSELFSKEHITSLSETVQCRGCQPLIAMAICIGSPSTSSAQPVSYCVSPFQKTSDNSRNPCSKCLSVDKTCGLFSTSRTAICLASPLRNSCSKVSLPPKAPISLSFQKS